MSLVTIQGSILSYQELADRILALPRKRNTLLIGVDGCGGSGKSTFGRKLKDSFEDATLIHFDDFYFPSSQIIKADPKEKPVGADFDWKRLMAQVILPLNENRAGNYQRYDWNTDSLAEWHQVPVGGVVIIEGISSTRNEMTDYYDYKVFVDTPREIRLARGLARDGEEARDMWEKNWMIAEELYVESHRPDLRADLVIDGTK
ncbi:uridine kinase [Fredinandcohnia sp. 179-A 10B2 NHS]|uniref:uridine kinase family protein n=1 Tax=Fredinandcohnia sp. 179-A 10B2 NHS TaxID=3235176 RepID=UPI0039A2ADD4